MDERTHAADGAPGPMSTDGKGLAFLGAFVDSERRVYAYILTLVPNRADAQDILQETSVVLWEKFDPADPPRNFTAWAKKIAYHKVLDMRKKRGRSRVVFNEAVLEAVSATAVSLGERIDDRDAALSECVSKLPERDRDLIERRFRKGATTQSTAAEVGRSLDAVYKALSRIRTALYDCVSDSLATGGGA